MNTKLIFGFSILCVVCFLELTAAKPKFKFNSDSTELSCKRCKLDKFPSWVYRLPNLKRIDFSHNRISSVPDSLYLLPKLEAVIFRDNKIELVGKEFLALSELKHIDLSQNRISYISEMILENKKLERLELWSNLLSFLPADIDKLPRLNYIDLRLNTFDNKEQEKLKIQFKSKKIYFSKNCNCGG
ncbi:MAG: leucine-rich repeat domain-containing protein [Bacteroidota bacterium]|jgi:Leucine-rich repeat (LRR) protein